jgi:hypothetical protein
MNVRLPDGTIIQNVPDGTTKADLVKKLQGNGMTVPADWLAEAAPPAPPTARERLLASTPMRVAKGMKDPIDGTAQLMQRMLPGGLVEAINRGADAIGGPGSFLGDVLGVRGMSQQELDTDIKGADKEYAAARKATGQQGADVARFVGNVASPVNAAVARVVPTIRAGSTAKVMAQKGAVAGAAGAATQPVMGEDYVTEKALQVGAGAVGGAVLSPVIGKASEAVARFVRERMRSGAIATPEAIQHEIRASLARDDIDLGQVPKQVVDRLTREAQEAMSKGQEIDAPALLRKLDFDRVGVQPLQGQLTRNPTQYARERDLRGIQGVGEPIANRLNEQAATIAGKFRKATAGAADPYEAGQTLVSRLQSKDKEMAGGVRAAYQAFRESTGKDLEVPLQGLAQDYAATLRDFGETIPSAVRRQFEGLGLLTGKQQKLLSIEDAERLIAVINKNYDPANKPLARSLDELRNGVQKAIIEVTDSGAGMEAGALASMARGQASERFRAIDSTPALKAAINDAAPDDFVRKYVINGKVRDINKMAELVGSEGQRTMQQQLLRHLEGKAFGTNVAGDGAGSQAGLNRALDGIGRNKLTAVLGAEQTDELYAIGRVMAYIQQQPAGSAVNNSNTGAAVANLLSKVGGTVKGAPYINDFLVKPITSFRERGEVTNALSGALAKKPTELDAETVNALTRLMRPAAVGSGAALGYSGR